MRFTTTSAIAVALLGSPLISALPSSSKASGNTLEARTFGTICFDSPLCFDCDYKTTHAGLCHSSHPLECVDGHCRIIGYARTADCATCPEGYKCEGGKITGCQTGYDYNDHEKTCTKSQVEVWRSAWYLLLIKYKALWTQYDNEVKWCDVELSKLTGIWYNLKAPLLKIQKAAAEKKRAEYKVYWDTCEVQYKTPTKACPIGW